MPQKQYSVVGMMTVASSAVYCAEGKVGFGLQTEQAQTTTTMMICGMFMAIGTLEAQESRLPSASGHIEGL